MTEIELLLAEGLILPAATIGEKIGVLGQSGSGKSYLAMRLAELMLKVGAQVVVLDPVGPWFSLRVSADGQGAGFPIPVFGGEHGDLPLDPRSGDLIADVIVDETISAVVDLSDFEMADQKRFAAAFAERLFHRKKRAKSPLHLILEEAQVFAPQNPEKDETVMLNRIERLARIGRNYGIGWTIVSQRPQEVHKKVLNQAGTLFALRTVGRHERKAIEDWVADKASATDAEMVRSLPSLETGTAHVWSPAFLRMSATVQISKRETFDSSATPAFGDARSEPKVLADVDLAALRERMAETIERAKVDDPKELRARVKELETELRRIPSKLPEPVIERVEVPVLSDETIATLTASVDSLSSMAMRLLDLGGEIRSALVSARQAQPEARKTDLQNMPRNIPKAIPEQPPRSFSQSSKSSAITTDIKVSGPQQRILDALAELEAVGLSDVARSNVAVYSDASPKSSAFGNNLGSLRSAALIDYPAPNRVCLTDAGRSQANPTAVPRTLAELHEAWYSHLSGPQARILRELVGEYPLMFEREALATVAGASPTSSAYGNNLGHLRGLGLISYPQRGMVAATALLFPAGLR